MDYQAIGEAVDRLITVPLSNWALQKGLPLHDIYQYLRDEAGGPLTMRAAHRLQKAVTPGDTALILTGFVMRDWLKPETDGPVGAAALARSLSLGLNALPVLLCEVAIICNISNWGAYGLCACLAALCGRGEVLHDRQTELHMLGACVRAGAVDSFSGLSRPDVDGLPEHISGHIIDLLHAILRQ